MNHRQCLKAVAAGLVVAPALASLPPGRLSTRRLGLSGSEVPILGFDSGSRFLGHTGEAV